MRYMMLIKHPGDYDLADVPQALFEAMGPFVEEYAKKGIFVDGGGLMPLKNATRVSVAGGKVTVTDGPFAEAKEVVGGYSICECQSHEEAVAVARHFMELHRLHWPAFQGESEVRPFQG